MMLNAPSAAIVSEDGENLFALLAILPGQLLPCWPAVEQGGINPDCQRANIPKHARVGNMPGARGA